MTDRLPPNLMRLFAPRPPARFMPPPEKNHWSQRPIPSISGVADFLKQLDQTRDPDYTPTPSIAQQKQDRIKARKEKADEERVRQKNAWNPQEATEWTADAFKTLFVARLNYETSEKALRLALEEFGPIRQVVMIKQKEDGKPRGYAFVEFEHERAIKEGNGMRIDGRRVVLDVERGRTVEGWLPRRLGGGLGKTRFGADKDNERTGNEKERMSRVRDRSRERRRSSRERPRSRSRDRRDRRRDDGRGGDHYGVRKRDRTRSRSRDRFAKRPARYDRR